MVEGIGGSAIAEAVVGVFLQTFIEGVDESGTVIGSAEQILGVVLHMIGNAFRQEIHKRFPVAVAEAVKHHAIDQGDFKGQKLANHRDALPVGAVHIIFPMQIDGPIQPEPPGDKGQRAGMVLQAFLRRGVAPGIMPGAFDAQCHIQSRFREKTGDYTEVRFSDSGQEMKKLAADERRYTQMEEKKGGEISHG